LAVAESEKNNAVKAVATMESEKDNALKAVSVAEAEKNNALKTVKDHTNNIAKLMEQLKTINEVKSC
jgi:predicted  nucleic acid-binding Zn-ribbon protein